MCCLSPLTTVLNYYDIKSLGGPPEGEGLIYSVLQFCITWTYNIHNTNTSAVSYYRHLSGQFVGVI